MADREHAGTARGACPGRMRTKALLVLAVLGLGACASTSSTTRNAASQSGPDGLSCATRVVAPSVPWEYTWVRDHYPGSQVVMQSLGECDGAPADELHVKTADGRRISLFFDISSFFGKEFE